MIVSSEAFLATEPAPRASRTSYFSLIIVGSLVFASAGSLAAHPVVVQPSRPNRKNKLKIVASYKTLHAWAIALNISSCSTRLAYLKLL